MFGALRQKEEGWLAVGFFAGRIDIVHAVRSPGRRPRLLRLESYERSADEGAALAVLRKKKKLAAYRCTTLMDPGTYQIVPVDSPDVPDAELRDAVRWRLKDVLDFPVERATVDVLKLPITPMAGRSAQLLAVAASDAVLGLRMGCFRKAGLDLQVVDIPEMAQRNIAALYEDENRGLAMLTFDQSGGLLTFTFQGELCVSRHIEFTTNQFEHADETRRTQMYERIGLDLQRSLDNFERMYNMITVSKVVVGPCAAAPGLVEFLRDYAYIPVEAADLTSVLDCESIPELRNLELQQERFVVIGAALREGQERAP